MAIKDTSYDCVGNMPRCENAVVVEELVQHQSEGLDDGLSDFVTVGSIDRRSECCKLFDEYTETEKLPRAEEVGPLCDATDDESATRLIAVWDDLRGDDIACFPS